MSSEAVILKADASFDLEVEVGDKVNKGDILGTQPDSEPLVSPTRAAIKEIKFNSSQHCFEIILFEESS